MCRTLRDRFTIIVLVWGLCMAGCGPSEDIVAQATPSTLEHEFSIGGVELNVVDASVRRSYSTYYLMNYPDSDELFIVLELAISGVGAPLDWAQSHLTLQGDQGPYPLEISRPVLIGENIEYRADFDFEYHYEFIYSVPRQVALGEMRLNYNDQPLVDLAPWLESQSFASLQAEQGTAEPAGTVLSGTGNLAAGEQSVVAGGSDNQALAVNSTVCGGSLNQAAVSYAFVGGGRENRAELFYATVGGGYGNLASARETTVCGGSRNEATDRYATVAGGIRNQASAQESTIAGGSHNQASDVYAAIAGGTRNHAAGYGSFVGAGAGNTAASDYAVIAGGLGNMAEGEYSFIGGGHGNQILGDYALVPGGSENLVESDFSIALGSNIHVLFEHPGSILLADSLPFPFSSESANELAIRASGGVRLVTALSDDGTATGGAVLPSGSGAWAQLSDLNSKADIADIDPQLILASLMNVPIQTWRYSAQPDSVRHIGPMAQDFYAAFGLGEDARFINSVDADGVALASIQALAGQVQQQADQLAILESRLESESDAGQSALLIVMVFVLGIMLGWLVNSNLDKKIFTDMVEG